MKKLLFIIPLLISAVALNAADRPLRERGKEPGMILDLQKISLGTISSVEEKKQYLSTVQLEKQRIQNYTLWFTKTLTTFTNAAITSVRTNWQMSF